MLARRGSSRLFFISFFISFCLFAIYSLRSRWDFSHLKFDSSQPTHWPLSNPQVDPSNFSDLRRLCDQTTWTDGLWVQCHSNARVDSEGKRSVHGGLNNVRNRLQSCLRVAIDAGSGAVIPSIATRNQTQLKNLGGGDPIPASTFFNMEYMMNALETECPQLRYALI
jgi:hypothetical protein